MAEEAKNVVFNVKQAHTFIKKFDPLKVAYRNATQSHPDGEELYVGFIQGIKTIKKLFAGAKSIDVSHNVTNSYNKVLACEAFFKDIKQKDTTPKVVRDKCEECGQIAEIHSDEMCFPCAAETQARDLNDLFTQRYEQASEKQKDMYLQNMNDFVDAIDAMNSECNEDTYNMMCDIAEVLERDLPPLREHIDDDFDEAEEVDDDDEVEDEEEEDVPKRKRDSNEDIHYRALKMLATFRRGSEDIFSNIDNTAALNRVVDRVTTIYQLKRIFKEFPDQEHILGGIYKDRESAEIAKSKVDENDQIVIFKTKYII